MRPLTVRQHQFYRFIVAYSQRHGYPPTIQEIARELDVSGNLGVLRHLAALETKGYIRRQGGRSRGISLVREGAGSVSLPLIGQVRAGPPQLALEDVVDHLAVDAALVKSVDSFLLQVQGDSMIDAHILDGDLAIVRPQLTAENGDIVVALMDGEATLKRFFRTGVGIRLQPENAAVQPILVSPGEDVRVVGKVTGILRRFEP